MVARVRCCAIRPKSNALLIAQDHPVAAPGLGVVQRHVGDVHQIGRAVLWCHAHRPGRGGADADGHHRCGIAFGVGNPKGLHAAAHRLANRLQRGGVAAGQDQRQFLTAIARDQVAVAPCARPDRLGHALETGITGLVPVGVVEILEVIDVQQEQAQRRALPDRARPGFGQVFVQRTPVGQTGQSVGPGQSFELLLHRLAGQQLAPQPLAQAGEQPDGDQGQQGVAADRSTPGSECLALGQGRNGQERELIGMMEAADAGIG